MRQRRHGVNDGANVNVYVFQIERVRAQTMVSMARVLAMAFDDFSAGSCGWVSVTVTMVWLLVLHITMNLQISLATIAITITTAQTVHLINHIT